MKILLVLLSLVVVLVGAMAVIGYLLPVGHTVSRTLEVKAPVDSVWRAISDAKGSVVWRKDLKSVEEVRLPSGEPAIKEVAKNGDSLTFLTLESREGARLVRKIAEKGLPFGGTWTYELSDRGKGVSALTITENGEVYNVIFRFMSRFVFGHTGTIDRYLSQLADHLK